MTKHTPGPWKPRPTRNRADGDVWCIDWSDRQEKVAEIVHGEANAAQTQGFDFSHFKECQIAELAIAKAKGEQA
jgi:hypothetical protein